ncbi:uroporphyrinogen-III C-methyltransferase [Halodesulfurarchaeum sp.]|uniref:uroporphyrinogen-III C-methyltransferase n=1 Tax=Halodesulfurarchaeum sp. TaxID=1980530 RepID=UPI002FC2EBB7
MGDSPEALIFEQAPVPGSSVSETDTATVPITPVGEINRQPPAPPVGRAMTRLNGEFEDGAATSGCEDDFTTAGAVEPSAELWADESGSLALVGAGPGDPGLLTVRAWRLLRSADVVLYDSLTSAAIISSLEGTECIDVGKRTEPRTTQTEIHDLMVARAEQGDSVVRLKGGDPVVFGRGGEEAEYLAEHGVPFRVVPGVTSVVAAPELAGIPVTHREISSSFTVITGHEAAEKSDSHVDWDALAERVSGGETLIVLMGVKRLPDYVSRLRDRGVPERVPVAMIEKVTWDQQQTVTGTLGTIIDRAEESAVEPPATTVIGEVVSMRDRVPNINWADGTSRSPDNR